MKNTRKQRKPLKNNVNKTITKNFKTTIKHKFLNSYEK